jgi:hypothetical protein
LDEAGISKKRVPAAVNAFQLRNILKDKPIIP